MLALLLILVFLGNMGMVCLLLGESILSGGLRVNIFLKEDLLHYVFLLTPPLGLILLDRHMSDGWQRMVPPIR